MKSKQKKRLQEMFEMPQPYYFPPHYCSLQQILEYLLEHLNINGVNHLCDFDLQFFDRCRIMSKTSFFTLPHKKKSHDNKQCRINPMGRLGRVPRGALWEEQEKTKRNVYRNHLNFELAFSKILPPSPQNNSFSTPLGRNFVNNLEKWWTQA